MNSEIDQDWATLREFVGKLDDDAMTDLSKAIWSMIDRKGTIWHFIGVLADTALTEAVARMVDQHLETNDIGPEPKP